MCYATSDELDIANPTLNPFATIEQHKLSCVKGPKNDIIDASATFNNK